MLLDGEDMSEKNYVIPTAVLRRLLDAAAGRYCNGDILSSEMDGQVSDKLGLQSADVVGIQSVLEQLIRLQCSSSSSSSSPSTDVTSDYPSQQHVSKKSSKSSTVMVVNPARYKTELCRQFEEHGSCRYGDKCQFAHGAVELRTLVRHPKYKTEMCRTFHTTGFCPYGLRCHFIHNDDERRLDSAARCPPSSPPLAAEPLLLAQPHCPPIFRSSASTSPTSTSTLLLPEVDSAQRGRPILARSSTLPEHSCVTYPYISQQVISFARWPACH